MNKSNNCLKKKKAFTLVEVIIVLAISTMVLALMYEFLTQGTKNMSVSQVKSTLQDEAEDVENELVKYITPCRKISNINSAPVTTSSTYGSVLDADKFYMGDIYSMDFEFYNGEISKLEYNNATKTLTLTTPQVGTKTAQNKVLAKHVESFKIKPLDAASNPTGNLAESTGVQFVIELKMKKGYTTITNPVTVNAKFRNKGVATDTP